MTWEDVYKKNLVERIKREKHPLELTDELEELARKDYRDIPEEEFTRLYWLGVVHDRPRTGYLMVRLRIPGGVLTPSQLRRIGEVSLRYGRNYAELTVRQDVQIHWVRLADLPRVLRELADVGITTIGTEGDTVRNVTSCVLAGVLKDELFDVRRTVRELTEAFLLDREYTDLPRKFKITVTACPYLCSVPEINDLSFVGVSKDGVEGYTVLVGGGLSLAPRIARHMPIFVPVDEVVEFTRAIIDVWSRDPRYRLSRVRARMKFLVDDLGVQRLVEKVEERMGKRLERIGRPPKALGRTDHLGVQELRDGRFSIGLAVPAGITSGDVLVKLADLADALGAEVRITHRQNLAIVGVEEEDVEKVLGAASSLNLRVDEAPLEAMSVACTGDPYCNFSIGDTKAYLLRLITIVRSRFGDRNDMPSIHVVGCPHSCAWYWIGDIGLMATTFRDEEGKPVKSYDILVNGRYGPEVKMGSVLFRRVPADAAHMYVEALIDVYLSERAEGESFGEFIDRVGLEHVANAVRARVGGP